MLHHNPESLTPAERQSLSIPLFLSIMLVVCVLGAVMAPALAGAWAGYQQLQIDNHENAIQHYQRGLGYLGEDYPELATAEFQIALRFDGAFQPAQQKLDEMKAKIAQTQASSGQANQNPISVKLLDEARVYTSQKQWSDAINRLEQLKGLDATFQTAAVSDLLFQAYSESGKEAVKSGQIEFGRERFEAALNLRRDPEIQRQRDLANLYLDGQQAVGYDWNAAIQKFSLLYQQDPNYDDVRKRLSDAYDQYGDRAAKTNAWCLAAKQYDSALAVLDDAQIAQKRANSMTRCKQAFTNTPTPAAQASAPISQTQLLVTPTPNASGENYRGVVTFISSQSCAGAGDVSGTVRDALGNPLVGYYVAYEGDSINRVSSRTDTNGLYKFTLGKDPALLRIFVLTSDGKTAAAINVNVQYPGGNNLNCHILVDWQRAQ